MSIAVKSRPICIMATPHKVVRRALCGVVYIICRKFQ